MTAYGAGKVLDHEVAACGLPAPSGSSDRMEDSLYVAVSPDEDLPLDPHQPVSVPGGSVALEIVLQFDEELSAGDDGAGDNWAGCAAAVVVGSSQGMG